MSNQGLIPIDGLSRVQRNVLF